MWSCRRDPLKWMIERNRDRVRDRRESAQLEQKRKRMHTMDISHFFPFLIHHFAPSRLPRPRTLYLFSSSYFRPGRTNHPQNLKYSNRRQCLHERIHPEQCFRGMGTCWTVSLHHKASLDHDQTRQSTQHNVFSVFLRSTHFMEYQDSVSISLTCLTG